MSLKNTIKELFSFSKTAQIGFLLFLLTIILVAVSPFLYFKKATPVPLLPDSSWARAVNELQQRTSLEDGPERESDDRLQGYQAPTTENGNTRSESSLFAFDPNKLDAGGFKRLGLRDRTISTLLKYRSKGGRFRKPDDLAKIYGLRPDEFERLKPYIRIEEATNGAYSRQNLKESEQTTAPPTFENRPRYQPRIIEINSAGIAEFESLYGIGSRLASRIVHFRDKLGGFYAIEQVGETYGVPDSTFQKIKPQLQVNAGAVKKININTATYDELNNHPYINSKTAFQVLKYRKETGRFSGIDQVQALVQPNDSFEKIGPYIEVN